MLRTLAQWLFAASLMLLAAGLWGRDQLPPATQALPALREEPSQLPDVRPAFGVQTGGVSYTVRPLFRYEIAGMVVSRHHSSAWWDIVHREWNDKLNVVDLCVVWGANLASDNFRRLRYWSEVFTCNVGTDNGEVWERFEQNALSNNHLLTADKRIAKTLESARPGDQVQIRGWLAEYRVEGDRPMTRGTSIRRDDRGNGACETIWVEDAVILRSANRGWRAAMNVALGGLLLGVVLWAAAPHRPRG